MNLRRNYLKSGKSASYIVFRVRNGSQEAMNKTPFCHKNVTWFICLKIHKKGFFEEWGWDARQERNPARRSCQWPRTDAKLIWGQFVKHSLWTANFITTEIPPLNIRLSGKHPSDNQGYNYSGSDETCSMICTLADAVYLIHLTLFFFPIIFPNFL